MRSLKLALIQWLCPLKRGGVEHRHTHTQEERDVHMKLQLGDASVSSGMPKIDRKLLQKLERGMEQILPASA